MNRNTRASLWAIFAIGAVLIVIPFAIGLPGKASAGQTMMDQLQPLMQPASVNKTVAYFDTTFVPLRPVANGAIHAADEIPKLIPALATQLHTTPSGVEQFLAAKFPATAALLGGLPKLAPIFANVPPGLVHYNPLVKALKANVGNFARVDSLPDMRLFTLILAVPGVLLVLLSSWSLLGTRRVQTRAVPAPAA